MIVKQRQAVVLGLSRREAYGHFQILCGNTSALLMPRKVKTLSAASYIGILASYKPECMGFSASKFIDLLLTTSSDNLSLCSEVDK